MRISRPSESLRYAGIYFLFPEFGWQLDIGNMERHRVDPTASSGSYVGTAYFAPIESLLPSYAAMTTSSPNYHTGVESSMKPGDWLIDDAYRSLGGKQPGLVKIDSVTVFGWRYKTEEGHKWYYVGPSTITYSPWMGLLIVLAFVVAVALAPAIAGAAKSAALAIKAKITAAAAAAANEAKKRAAEAARNLLPPLTQPPSGTPESSSNEPEPKEAGIPALAMLAALYFLR